MLTGIIFGLGLSELALIIVAVLLFMGPKRIQTIKPFLKVLYKNYLAYMREVTAMQGEMDEMKKTIMEPLEEVEREAEAELRKVEKEATKGMEGADEIKQGLRTIIDARKKEMEQLKKEAEIEDTSKAGQKVNAVVSRGANVGFLGKQAPGAQMPQTTGARTPQAAASQMQPGRQIAPFMQGQRPGLATSQMQRQQPGSQMAASTQPTKGIPNFMAMRGQPASFQMPGIASGLAPVKNPLDEKAKPQTTSSSRPKVDMALAPVTQKAEVPETEARIEAKPEPAAPLETKSGKPGEVELSETSTPLKAEGAVIIARKSKAAYIQEQPLEKEPIVNKRAKKEDRPLGKGDQAKKPKDKKSRRRR